jgi:hypothetical protein
MTRSGRRVRAGRRWVAGATMTLLALSLSACAGGITDVMTAGVKDSAGMTRAEVERMTPEEQFDLMEERYERIKGLMTEAQESISTGIWSWLSGGTAGPESGPTAADPVRGATLQNSYFLRVTRGISPAGAVGNREDAEPVVAYFESKGWKARLIEVPDELDVGDHRWEAQADTDDGYHFRYWVQENGYYSMEVLSGVFWCNYDQLSDDVSYRIPEDRFFPPGEESLPGVYIPFPKWSDPYLWGPDVDADWL